MATRQGHSEGGDVWAPVPDPTKLTTDAVQALKEQLIALFEKQFDFVEKEVVRLRAEIDASPKLMVEQIKHLEALTNEKFRAVELQFAGRDTALAAALLAQKTSVEEQNKSNALSIAKSEASFDKRIDGVSALISNQSANLDSKINDAKDRLTAIESRGKGISDSYGWLIAFIGVMVGGGGLIAFFAR